jgi:hypothetical protein
MFKTIKEKGGDLERKRPFKCEGCYKFEWCLLSFDEAFECLGAFKNVADNLNKFQEYMKGNKKL